MRYRTILAACMLLAVGVSASAAETEAVSEYINAENTDAGVATVGEMSAIQDVVEDWMVPIYPEELKDGVYQIEAESSSQMFQIEECTLTVADGKMTALMTMGGKGYLKLYMGTGEEALQASESDYISFVEAEDGRHTYEIPVEALDCGIACSAFSKNREKWYDRTLVFLASSLPLDVYKELKLTAVEDLQLEDGTYTVEVSLEGGSGKTRVESPAMLYIEEGLAMAEITFGSANYDYVIADGEKCLLLNEEGNSSFLIPVAGFDYNLPITVDSIAIGKPRELDYTIRFDSSTITQKAE